MHTFVGVDHDLNPIILDFRGTKNTCTD